MCCARKVSGARKAGGTRHHMGRFALSGRFIAFFGISEAEPEESRSETCPISCGHAVFSLCRPDRAETSFFVCMITQKQTGLSMPRSIALQLQCKHTQFSEEYGMDAVPRVEDPSLSAVTQSKLSSRSEHPGESQSSLQGSDKGPSLLSDPYCTGNRHDPLGSSPRPDPFSFIILSFWINLAQFGVAAGNASN
jgi:hypothetical protein